MKYLFEHNIKIDPRVTDIYFHPSTGGFPPSQAYVSFIYNGKSIDILQDDFCDNKEIRVVDGEMMELSKSQRKRLKDISDEKELLRILKEEWELKWRLFRLERPLDCCYY